MANLISPKKVCDTLGISQSALRIYCDKYARHLSTEATTTPRRFTQADLHALAFVVASTKEGKTHTEVLETWDEEYPNFEWESEGHTQPTDPTGPTEGDSTALVPVSALKAAQALMLDAQRREEAARDEARERERELQEQVNQLLRELGKAEGELAAMKAPKPKGFWSRLFGGGE